MYSERLQLVRRTLATVPMILLAASVLTGQVCAQERKAPVQAEYRVKAAFIYNFIKFVEWPANGSANRDEIRLCTLGAYPDAEAFEDLSGEEVRGKRLTVQSLQDEREARSCDVVFLPSTQSRNLPHVMSALAGIPILTIGDTEGYARQGVMINMFLENKRVRFEINQASAETAGLRISSKLLKLATTVIGARGEEEK
jgi:hypothetical protein